MLNFKRIEEAINIISKEKNISKQDLIDVIEAALKTAYKKDYGNKEENVNAHLDLKAGELEITVEKTVVSEVENPFTEITLEELGDDGEGFEEGDIVELDVTDNIKGKDLEETFGRIASQAARQVIVQKIGEREKEKIYELFKDREGEIISVKVDIIENGKVILDYNGTQITLPKGEQVSRDRYEQGQRMYVYIAEAVEVENAPPKVVISRKPADLVAKVFETQVPELEDGTIRIENIVRQAGVKTKILVTSDYDEIDPAGTLIGPKGMRVKAIMDEFNGEKIDIISANDEVGEMIAKSLTPAKITKVEFDEENKQAIVYLNAEERSKAVGKNGINVIQASKLTGYEIDIQENK
ncbi:MAG: transcription termination factor NusA [Candidatus Gracilibacteria bacterium]|nr:transcription termination factor NusA [Candidatus Gracilibacteria bacterium]